MTATSSNGYTWNFDWALQSVINQRGKTSVVFVNGIFTDDNTTQTNHIISHLGLTDFGKSLPNGYDYRNSFEGENDKEIYSVLNRSVFSDLDASEQIERLHLPLESILYTPALIGAKAKNYDSNSEDYKLVKKLKDDDTMFHLLHISDEDIKKVVNFLDNFIDGGLNGIGQKFESVVVSDLIEAAIQILTVNGSSNVSKETNNKWTVKVQNLLNSPNRSVIFVPHSQGNLFIEDGLIEKKVELEKFSEKMRILALGSPTNYSQLNREYGGKFSYEQLSNAINTNQSLIGQGANLIGLTLQDGITQLQTDVRTEKELLEHIFKKLFTYNALAAFGLEHDLELYLQRDDVKQAFEEFFYQVNPKGYYFPYATLTTIIEGSSGTEHGDWITGQFFSEKINGLGKNDVIRGYEGDDELTGDEGYDFLDGGSGIDTGNYWNSPSGIVVSMNSFNLGSEILFFNTYSDAYIVQDGHGQEDVLVDIEKISGSNKNDQMTGGKGKDIFYGQGGGDYYEGREGNDEFYGGSGSDTGLGGSDKDDLRGEGDNDFLYGDSGDDTIYGGDNDDWIEGNDDNDFLRGEGLGLIAFLEELVMTILQVVMVMTYFGVGMVMT